MESLLDSLDDLVSFATSFIGESSIIRTQPESPAGFLRSGDPADLLATIVLSRSSEQPAEEPEILDIVSVCVIDGAVALLKLPILNLGTRVWIRCSKFLTLALISETICTPLLLEVVVAALFEEVALAMETFRAVIGRGVGGLSLFCVGVRLGAVVDRVRELESEAGGVDR